MYTIGDLRRAIADTPDDLEVWISVGNERDDLHLELTINTSYVAGDVAWFVANYDEG